MKEITIAYLRKDLVSQGDIPPVKKDGVELYWDDIDWGEQLFFVIELDESVSDEYQLRLTSPKTGMFHAVSIDFDFQNFTITTDI